VELDELHVDQLRSGVVGQRVSVPGILPAVAGNAEGSPDASGGHDHSLGLEYAEAPSLAIVGEGSDHPPVTFEERRHRLLHVEVDALVDAVILQRTNQFETGSVAYVGQPGIGVAPEVALQDAAVRCAIEHRAPRLEFPHPVGRFLGVQFGHAPVVEVLAPAHGVGKVHLAGVTVVHVGQRRRDAAFGHDRVGLTQE